MVSPPKAVRAHAPYVVVNGYVYSWGANAVHNNWYYGWQRPHPSTRTIAVIDYYGLPSAMKTSPYYPSQSWNRSDNPHTWVVGDVAPVEGGTAIYIYWHDGHWPTATHIHLYTWTWDGYWIETFDLTEGPTFVADIHVRSQSVYCNAGSGYPHCGGKVISHEVDEYSSHNSIMYKDTPGGIPYELPSSADRHTAEVCIPVYPWVFPC